jgi:Na+-driven multidrug efflux pump
LGLNNVDWAIVQVLTSDDLPINTRALLIDGLGLTGVAWAASLAAVLSVLNLIWVLARPTRTPVPQPSS